MIIKFAPRRRLIFAATSLLAASYSYAQEQNGCWLGDSDTKWTDGLIAGTDTVTLTIPQSPDAGKFARLKVVITP